MCKDQLFIYRNDGYEIRRQIRVGFIRNDRLVVNAFLGIVYCKSYFLLVYFGTEIFLTSLEIRHPSFASCTQMACVWWGWVDWGGGVGEGVHCSFFFFFWGGGVKGCIVVYIIYFYISSLTVRTCSSTEELHSVKWMVVLPSVPS